MPTVNIELLGPINMYLGLGLEVVCAIVLGAMVGLDRENKNKAAGLKTHILICLGATLFTAISLLNIQGVAPPVDPNRMAAQVVSGIGFLGAGAIIQSRGQIMGLTTAAGIWVVAAIGVAIGSGFPLSACIFTISLYFVLSNVDNIYHKLRPRKYYYLEVVSENDIEAEVLDVLHDLEINQFKLSELSDEKGRRYAVHLYVKASDRALKHLLSRLKLNDDIKFVNRRPLKQNPFVSDNDERD